MTDLKFEEISHCRFSNLDVAWRPYSKVDIICSRFSSGEWHKAVFDTDSEEEWRNLLLNYSQFICCYMLTNLHLNEDVGFIYLYLESIGVVSIHGGGWKKGTSGTISYYKGFFLIIESLLKYGFKVRTSCLSNNYKAYRFLKSIGFVKYKEIQGLIYMWINKDRLHRSIFYSRFA